MTATVQEMEFLDKLEHAAPPESKASVQAERERVSGGTKAAPATAEQAQQTADTSRAAVQPEEVQAYGLTPEQAETLADYRNARTLVGHDIATLNPAQLELLRSLGLLEDDV